MGGENEIKVESKTKSQSLADEMLVGTIRIHTSAGQVHFHDDANQTKVAIPVAEWWRMWNEFKTKGKIEYRDMTNSSFLLIESTNESFKPPVEDGKSIANHGVQIGLYKVRYSSTLSALENFTLKK